MKQNKKVSPSGILIENTLSMAVQQRNHRRNPIQLIMIAVFGAAGSILTFLSMFQPKCHPAVLYGILAAELLLCLVMALFPQRCRPLRIGVLLLYIGLLYVFRHAFYDGFICLVNTVYKAIYMTDWDRFTVSGELTEAYAVTVFLVLAFAPILYMICNAAIRFQNFFLALIATFPYVEIGFYFGVPADHFCASMLLAFWFSMASIHLADLGSFHGKGQNSFLRRDNSFFPVSSMRFMVTEKIGISVLAFVMVLCLLLQQILDITGYQRSDKIKTMRSNMQDFMASVMLGDDSSSSELWKSLWVNRKQKDDRVVVSLGEKARQEFDHVSVSGMTLSDLPEGRIYMKYCTGEEYDGSSWRIPEASVYGTHDVFRCFEELDYYPQEFLYENLMPGQQSDISMTLRQTEDIISKCIPYAVSGDEALQFSHDNNAATFPLSYRIAGNQDYENLLQRTEHYFFSEPNSYLHCRPQNQDFFSQMFDFNVFNDMEMTIRWDSPQLFSEKTMEANLLCYYGYTDYVQETDTQIPDTPAMEHVRSKYDALLRSYDPSAATAADTITFLQEIRAALAREMTYTLAPGRTPADWDFVEYFLTENRKGYCMHYATAGVILARMAGIPARYCEGYMIDCTTNTSLKTTEQNGETIYTVDVLDSNAHAWGEFYLSGWGWIPFEFTYTQYEPPQETMPATEPATEPPMTVVSEVTSYVPMPTEMVTMTETIPNDVQPDGGSEIVRKIFLPILMVLGVAVLIISIILLIARVRVYALRKRNKQFSQKDRNAAAHCAYAYLLRLLAYCDVNIHAQRLSDIAQDGMERCGKFLGNYDLDAAIAVAGKAKYSPHMVTAEELQLLIRTARQLAHGIYDAAGTAERLKLKFFLHFV